MPQTEPTDSQRSGSSRTITALWHNFHFSGRVIMCSVLFGLGLILIGSLIFAINMDDGSSPSQYDNPADVPTKPPSMVVGPVVMGIGCFIVVVGITMCLFETQVCRKKTADANPLISDNTANSNRNGLVPAAVPASSHSHRHGNYKNGASPKRSKGRHAKSHSKERNQQKTPSPRTTPVTIETQKHFMTSSEENFLTPPNTFNGHTALVHSNSRDAENQTSSSLMKSFASSGPSWVQSTEFETPSTSFRDTSVSLDNSMEVGEIQESEDMNTTDLLKSKINAGFLTPITLEEEKIQDMSTKIQNEKKELNDTQDKKESDMHFNNDDKCKLSDTIITSEKDLKNIDEKPEEFEIKTTEVNIQKSEDVAAENNLTEPIADQDKQDTESIDTHELISHESNESNSLEKVIAVASEKRNTNEVLDTNVVDDEKQLTKSEEEQREKIISKEDLSITISEINEDEKCSLTPDEGSTKSDSNKDEKYIDLESSVSSNETVVSQGTIIEKHVSHKISKESELEPQEKLMDKAVLLIKIESANDDASLQKDGVNLQRTQSSVKESDTGSSDPNDSQSPDKKEVEESEVLSKDNDS